MNLDFLKHASQTLEQGSVSRRAALTQGARLGAGAALAVTPLFAMARRTHAARYGPLHLGADASPEEILNFALTLEYLEYFYYLRGVRDGDIPAQHRPLFEVIRDHELAHVELLRGAIQGMNASPVFFEEGDFDFTALGFDPFASGNFGLFAALSQGLEDTGVRAYKGQAPALVMGGDLLTVALQIHSVEARHASAVRRLRGEFGYILLDQTTEPAIQAVYEGEDNTVQAGVDLAQALGNRYTIEQITAAFDEPFTMDDVLAIAGPLITGDGMDN